MCASFIFFFIARYTSRRNNFDIKLINLHVHSFKLFKVFFIMQFMILLGMAYGYIMFINGMNIKHFIINSIRSIRLESLGYMFNTMICLILHTVCNVQWKLIWNVVFFSVSFFSFYLLGDSYHKNSFVLNDQVEVLFYDFYKMYLDFPLNVSTFACSCGYVMWKILVLDFKFLRYTCTCNFRT